MKALKLVLTGTYCVLLSISQLGFSQNKPVVLSGYLREAGSRESLPGAAVYIPSLKQGTTANAF